MNRTSAHQFVFKKKRSVKTIGHKMNDGALGNGVLETFFSERERKKNDKYDVIFYRILSILLESECKLQFWLKILISYSLWI